MKKKFIIFVVVSLLSQCFLFADDAFGNRICSIDSSFLMKDWNKFGWGIDGTYEQKIFNCFSVRGGIGYSIMWYTEEDLTLTSYNGSADLLFYPFAKGLDKLYLGAQGKAEFFNYDGDDYNSDNNRDILYSVSPIIGWKLTFFKSIMIDVFASYKYVLNPGEQNPVISDLVKNNMEYGIRFKIYLIKLVNYSIEKALHPFD